MPSTYRAISSPRYTLRPGFEGKGLPATVSFYGAAPAPFEAYEVTYKPSIEITDHRGSVTYSNYFFGDAIKTLDEAERICDALNPATTHPVTLEY